MQRNGLIDVEESVLASNEMAELVSKLQEERSGAVTILTNNNHQADNTP